jgi:hypothetical protein
MKQHSVYDCNIIQLPKIHNPAGNITIVENHINIPFDVKRVYYLYDVPGGEERGGHAHRELQQFVISISGAFDVMLNDSINKKIVHLDRPYFGLHIVPGIWRELLNFSSGAICFVLASEEYIMNDYIRVYSDFLDYKK